MRSATPACVTAAIVSPPPTTEKAADAATAFATASPPPARRGDPPARPGPDAGPRLRRRDLAHADDAPRRAVEPVGHDRVHGQHQAHAAPPGGLERAPGGLAPAR